MSAPVASARKSVPDPVETAWRVHGAVVDWTGKVDAKASFALSIESAALAGLAALAGGGHRLSEVHGVPGLFLLWSGVVLLCAAVGLAASVVAPRMRSDQSAAEAPDNFVYFGHLRLWNPEQLAQTLRTADPLPMLSRQLVAMSSIAWRKHQLVQASMCAAALGVLVVGIAAATV